MKIAILGYADQGKSAYEYWNRDGNELTVCDQNNELTLPAGAQSQLGADYLNRLAQFDLLVRTPSIHPHDIQAANPETPNILEKVTSNTNEFFKVCPSKNIIGITGTKGKGTTCTLVAKMLEAAGQRVHLGGNIGTPPLELLKNDIKPDDWVVLELANFQLIDLNYSPHIAVVLMVEAEHLDWHKDVEEYVNAKKQLFVRQKPEDVAIYYAENKISTSVADTSGGKHLAYFATPGAEVKNGAITIAGQEICKTDELKLLGKHNWQNACAAVTAVWQITQDINAIRSVVTSFTGLEHRLEFVRELDGVKYYDDSFGTTPGTAQVAIAAFEQPKVIILGGSDKGASYNDLAKTVANSNVRHTLLIGDQAERIRQALDMAGYTNYSPGGNDMAEIVAKARSYSLNGDVVLLSTACASFGMFRNYKDRGEQFKREVLKLV